MPAPRSGCWGLAGDAAERAGRRRRRPGTARDRDGAGVIRLPDAAGRGACAASSRRRHRARPPRDAPADRSTTGAGSRCRAASPTIEAATVDRFVPQMVNFELVGGVDFQKGCYPGQEVVARSQYRGTIKRRTFLFDGDGASPSPGQDVFVAGAEGEPAGTVANAAASPDGWRQRAGRGAAGRARRRRAAPRQRRRAGAASRCPALRGARSTPKPPPERSRRAAPMRELFVYYRVDDAHAAAARRAVAGDARPPAPAHPGLDARLLIRAGDGSAPADLDGDLRRCRARPTASTRTSRLRSKPRPRAGRTSSPARGMSRRSSAIRASETDVARLPLSGPARLRARAASRRGRCRPRRTPARGA